MWQSRAQESKGGTRAINGSFETGGGSRCGLAQPWPQRLQQIQRGTGVSWVQLSVPLGRLQLREDVVLRRRVIRGQSQCGGLRQTAGGKSEVRWSWALGETVHTAENQSWEQFGWNCT
jgi:hypothetical protein